jgi:hypothetical protein
VCLNLSSGLRRPLDRADVVLVVLPDSPGDAASLLAKATAALLCLTRFSKPRAQVRSRSCCLAFWAWQRTERAPGIRSIRR